MKIIFLYTLLLLLASCGGGSAISKKLATCDSLVITFNYGMSDSVIKTVSTTEKKALTKVAGFLSGKKTEQFKCGYDGNIVFYKKGQILLPLVFKYTEEGCRHFLFDMDNKVMSTEMSNEAVDFFKSLLAGNGVN
jgi:hypothetical protein